MRFSISFPPLIDRASPEPYRQTIELAQAAERAGFDSLTLGQHHFMTGVVSDPFAVLTAIASHTTRLRLGTTIFLLPLHHPLRVAEQVATLDEISGGRAVLGVGVGWSPHEYSAYGAKTTERGARIEEALSILRRVWTEEDVAHQGRFWSFPALTLYPRPIQQPRPPLWVAGIALKAIDRAARLGDAWLCDPVQTRSEVERLRSHYTNTCATLGREPAWMLRRYARLGDRDEIEESWLPGFVERNLAYWRQSTEGPGERELFERIDRGEKISTLDIARNRFMWGSPEDIICEIGEYARLGPTEFSVSFSGGMTAHRWEVHTENDYQDYLQSIETFGQEIIPAFRD
jgi:probable F420-dependent oxidoreductase